MHRRHVNIVSIVLIAPLLALGGYAAYGKWRDFKDRMGLFANCYSDRLNHIGFACELAASDRDGRLPGKSDIVNRLDTQAPRSFYTTCSGCGHPFIWNDAISQLDLRTAGRVALVWCPPGSHGRYVGAVVIENGRVETRMLTLHELANLQQSPSK